MVLQLAGRARCYQILTVKTGLVTKRINLPRSWIRPVERHKQLQRDMRFGTWKVRSVYRAGSLATDVRELERNTLDLVVVQEVRLEKRGTVRAVHYIFYGKEKQNHQLGTGFFVNH